jgi:uncharacterized protein (TIGR02284 family)
MDTDSLIAILNNLIQTCKDGEQGFRKCAGHVTDPELKSFFMNRADSCATSSQELQRCVRVYGGEPQTVSSISGSLHRRWIDIKSTLTGNDDQQVLSECERGEEMALESYRNALEKNLPAQVLTIVEKQYQGVKKNYAQVRALRDQARAQG